MSKFSYLEIPLPSHSPPNHPQFPLPQPPHTPSHLSILKNTYINIITTNYFLKRRKKKGKRKQKQKKKGKTNKRKKENRKHFEVSSIVDLVDFLDVCTGTG